MMMGLFTSAFMLGLLFNAAPGAVFTESLRRGLQGGYRPALYVQIGSLLGDATWAILGLAGAGLLFQIPAVRTPLTLLGAAYLGWLGWRCWVPAESDSPAAAAMQSGSASEPAGTQPAIPVRRTESAHHGALFSGASLSLTNPANVFYWAALGGVLGSLGVSEPGPRHYVVFFSGFMASSLAWCFICAGIIHVLHRSMSARLTWGVNALCGLALMGLAMRSGWELLQAHL